MAVTHDQRRLIENPAGRGRVYKGAIFIAEVDYNLQVVLTAPQTSISSQPMVTGSIRRLDNADILWGTELLTLHMQDKRK